MINHLISFSPFFKNSSPLKQKIKFSLNKKNKESIEWLRKNYLVKEIKNKKEILFEIEYK